MFTVSSKQWNETEVIQLTDHSSKTRVEIIPSCGGILHSFSVPHRQSMLNVIEQYEDPDDFKNNVAAKGFKSCKLSPFVCRIKKGRYKFGDEAYKLKKFLLNGNALHGLIYDAAFTVKYTYADDKHAGVALEYKYRGKEEGYPFYFDCVITYHLKENNELIISTDISNKDEVLIPIQDGWHPYFTFGGSINELLLEFKSSEQVVFDKEIIPTGKTEKYNAFTTMKKIGSTTFDDCFILEKPGLVTGNAAACILRDPEKQIQVEIRPDRTYPYIQFYTPPHRQSIAIENLSGAPDGFNNGMGVTVLPPDANKVFTVTYKVVALD